MPCVPPLHLVVVDEVLLLSSDHAVPGSQVEGGDPAPPPVSLGLLVLVEGVPGVRYIPGLLGLYLV